MLKSNRVNETAERKERGLDYTVITDSFIRRFGTLMKLGRPKRYGSYTRGEMCILNYLYDQNEPAQPGELSAIMDASSARVAAALRTLESKGQIARCVDGADRRRVLVNITEAGRQLVEARRREVRDYFAQIICQLGEDDVREGMRILGRIMKIAESLEDAPAESAAFERGGDDLAG